MMEVLWLHFHHKSSNSIDEPHIFAYKSCRLVVNGICMSQIRGLLWLTGPDENYFKRLLSTMFGFFHASLHCIQNECVVVSEVLTLIYCVVGSVLRCFISISDGEAHGYYGNRRREYCDKNSGTIEDTER